ncbi:YbaN family protein [Vandammella animalimorsus]|nr:YbaN family protein [Vandammella animalimorsus]
MTTERSDPPGVLPADTAPTPACAGKACATQVGPDETAAPPGTPSPAPKPMRPLAPIARALLYLLAMCSLLLGIIGAFTPGMPTTVFILISAWAAARSSPRLHQWLRMHRMFGPMLRNWEDGGYVHRRAKRAASLTMLASALLMLLVGVPMGVFWLASGCMAAVAAWLWLRPEPPEDRQ